MPNAVPFISIDQNCQPLWDTIPKLHALAAAGRRGRHAIEDIDTAFSRQGAKPGDCRLELLPERYYRGGHSDWGAALFCHDFLGRLPLDIRQLEPYTGRTTAALARLLQTEVDGLYARWSASDNWQLVGASYADDPRWHRVIGDVRLAEARPFVLELLARSRRDLLACFPESAVQARLTAWFDRQEHFARGALESEPDAPLTALYRRWLAAEIGDAAALCLTSDVFGIDQAAAPALLPGIFLSRYEEACAAYNDAVRDLPAGIAPLHTRQGELPFFVVMRRHGRLVRTAMAWDGNTLAAGDCAWPVTAGVLPREAMAADGVLAVAGKALLLVLEARLEPQGAALALPHLGSLYMPAAYAFERNLRDRGLLGVPAHPVWRVRLRFFEHWQGCATRVRPPAYLRAALGVEEAPAGDLAEAIAAATAAARQTLEACRDETRRAALLAQRFPELTGERDAREAYRRGLAADPARREESTRIWQEIKELDRKLAESQAAWVVQLLRLLDLGYYDSRGALLPWSLALGGEAFYHGVVAAARIETEGD